jgi:hypothetical protein
MTSPSSYPKPDHINPNIVLITIDGVRTQEVFYGTDSSLSSDDYISETKLFPNIYNYGAENGIMIGRDSPMYATGPVFISLPGYLEIMRGAQVKDCFVNTCKPKYKSTILDDLYYKNYSNIAVFSSWKPIRNIFDKDEKRFHFNNGRTNNLPIIFPEDISYRADEDTIYEAFSYIESNSPQFIWISLGDADGWAHRNNYEKYIDSLQRSDQFIGQIIERYKNTDYGKNMTIIVTTDHGRSKIWTNHFKDKESSKVWMMMYGYNISKLGFMNINHKLYLSDIRQTILHIINN